MQAELATLHEKVHALTSNLSAASSENSALHNEISKQKTEYERRLKDIEDSTAALGESEAAARADQKAARSEFDSQVALAREADEKYNRELVAHAEAVKEATRIREELSAMRTRLSEAVNQNNTAQANLAASTSSWESQRSTLSKELDDLKQRCVPSRKCRRHLDRGSFDETRKQNVLLHQHLDSVTAQATQIHAQSDSISKSDKTPGDELNQVVHYLRGQQEILELQLQLEKQEKSRLQVKLEHVEKSLDESRAQLTEERHAASTQSVQTAQHEELLAKINELDILRESNGTLRSESASNSRKAAQYAAQIRALEDQLGPLQEQVVSLQAEISARDDQIRLLTEDNNRWRQRNEQVLAKYERIDPAELQALKDEVERLKGVNEEKETALRELSRAKDEEAEQFRSHIAGLESGVSHHAVSQRTELRCGFLAGAELADSSRALAHAASGARVAQSLQGDPGDREDPAREDSTARVGPGCSQAKG
jgi:nucleoprotein TPR